MARVTALRSLGRGRVAVELDGAPWRTLPAEVVGRAGMAVGRELDRPALRLLRRELRRGEALATATRALRSRDASRRRLADRLDRVVPAAARDEALHVLERAGILDDARFAKTRVRSLEERGYGDAAIRYDLERQGIDQELSAAAMAELAPESERARTIAEQRGSSSRTARLLASKGFDADTVEAVLGGSFAAEA